MKKKYIFGFAILLIFLLVFVFFINNKKEDNTPKNVANVIGDIKEFNYTLDDRDTKLFKNTFQNLKRELEKEEIDGKNYASLLAKLFIIDLYTLNNKINKYDVGGVEYVAPDIEGNFKLKLQDTLYKYIIDNTDSKRIQDLPEVKEVEILNIEIDKYSIGDKIYPDYIVKLQWSYVKDLDYDKEGEIIFIKDDNGKLSMIEFNIKESDE